MTKKEKITLLLPTKNEIIGMKVILPLIDREWIDEILVVDDSADGTLEYALSQGCKAIRQTSKGLSGAYFDGVAQAVGDVIITFSPDGNSLPELIPPLIAKMREGYDMVIVSRYLPGAFSEDDDVVTAFGNWLFTKMVNVMFGGNYTDSLVMFRAWRKDAFRFVEFNSGRAGPDIHMTIIAAKQKLRVTEIPGDEPIRIGGKRKMQPLLNGLSILRLLGREALRRPRRNPHEAQQTG